MVFIDYQLSLCYRNLFVSPLGPQVPCQSSSNPQKEEHHQQPEDSVKDPEFSVKDVADPVDGTSACVFFRRLGEGCCLKQSHFHL